MNRYGQRFVVLHDFINYCRDLNIKINEREIESYEKSGAMLPAARIIYPSDYASQKNDPSASIDLSQWPEIGELRERPRYSIEAHADMADEELIHCFDRRIGRNTLLHRPVSGDHQPWSMYEPHGKAEHYYHYWQVHQLSLLQQYPLGHPAMGMFKDKGAFDALSFWVTLHLREYSRTFASIALNQRKHS